MATVEIEKYCRNCVSRDFVNGKGLVCKRTRELPDFDEECENFEKDEELLKMAPPKPDDFPVSMTEEELGADRWVQHHELTLTRLNELIAILSNNEIPVGSRIKPGGESFTQLGRVLNKFENLENNRNDKYIE